MSTAAQNRATGNYRARLVQRGIKRFEMMALETDRELLRALAHRLAEEGPEADRARTEVKALVADNPPKRAEFPRHCVALRWSGLISTYRVRVSKDALFP